jgi:hypothetical protein
MKRTVMPDQIWHVIVTPIFFTIIHPLALILFLTIGIRLNE